MTVEEEVAEERAHQGLPEGRRPHHPAARGPAAPRCPDPRCMAARRPHRLAPDVLGIVDSLELGDDLDVEAILERDHFDSGLDDNDGFYWSDPDR